MNVGWQRFESESNMTNYEYQDLRVKQIYNDGRLVNIIVVEGLYPQDPLHVCRNV